MTSHFQVDVPELLSFPLTPPPLRSPFTVPEQLCKLIPYAGLSIMHIEHLPFRGSRNGRDCPRSKQAKLPHLTWTARSLLPRPHARASAIALRTLRHLIHRF